MLDFSKFSNEDMNELKKLISVNVEKSEMENTYLFSIDVDNKAKLFIWCYRFLLNAYNIIDNISVRDEIKKELDMSKNKYDKINRLVFQMTNDVEFGKHMKTTKIFNLINENQEVDNIIDVFSIILEKISVVNISRFKGFLLEGKSGEEFKKIME